MSEITNKETQENGEIDNLIGVTKFNWTIKNYKNVIFHQSVIVSKHFCIEGIPDLKFVLQVYKRNHSSCLSSRGNYIWFRISKINSRQYSLKNPLIIKLSLGALKRKVITKTARVILIFRCGVEESELNEIMANTNCLHISLKIKPLRNTNEKDVNPSPSTINNNFQSFLNNDVLSDVAFKINNDKFPAHKIMLASASPVFEKMFSHQMRENITNIVEINETDPEVLKEMLRYIYTGQVENLKTMALGLYEISNKYDIANLRLTCEKHLEKCLSLENVVCILELADCHNSAKLKTKCIKYIDENFEEISKTEAFKNIKKELLLDFIFNTRI